jgi:hypothetical protein
MERRSAKDRSPLSIFNSKIYEPGNSPEFAKFRTAVDIIFFDEFVVPTHEFMAYQQFIDSYYFDLELIGAANNYYFTAFKVKRS